MEILLACKELIANAKAGCPDLTFKDLCLDILAKARLVLTNEQFEELRFFAEEQLKEEKAAVNKGNKIPIE
jgi:hypothetical protein